MIYTLGIDIGGTKIEGIFVNDQGKILKKIRIPTESDQPKKVTLSNIDSVIKGLLIEAKRKKKPIKGIGVGVPGPVPPDNKLIMLANIPKLEGMNLKAHIERKFKKFTICENDSNCFTLAEALYGAGKNKKIVVGISWGTGLGSGIVIDKKIFRGSGGLAGEPGHTVINPDAKVKCGAGHYGDIESYSSGANLVKYYKLFGGKNKNADGKFIMEMEDAAARKTANQAIHYFAIGAAFIANMLNPDVIVLGGGISNNMQYKKINELTNSFVATAIRGTFKIVKHKIGDSAGSLGAASLIFTKKL